MEKRGTVLVVDDNRLNRIILAKSVAQAGYDVEMAESGLEALAMLRAGSFDVVLLDLVMPEMDGYAVLAEIKQDDALRHLPVIVVSDLNDMASVVECIRLGAADHLPKPAEPLLLKARLDASMVAKRLHDAEQAHVVQLELRNQELDAFAHSVAHDLKSPLTSIVGYGDMLLTRSERISEEMHWDYIRRMTENGRRMNNIIRELLMLASIRKEEVVHQPVDMVEVVEGALQRLTFIIESKNPQLFLPEAWPVVLGHGPWVEEIWVNYLSNGLKYGGDPPRLELGAEQRDDLAYFWLKDNGPGIKPEERERLFVPFTRMSQVRTEGQGLGLSIVQRIATKLGGRVGVESQPGAGSKFWFALPLAD